MRLITDTVEFCTRQMPRWHPISISGYHIREAGSTAVQELAFTLADGFAYVEAALERGLDIDEFAPRLSFFFNSHNDFFEEVAKYRAARRIFARRMKNRYGAQHPRSLLMRFHTQTAGCTLTAQQPENNFIRVTIQALAGVLGGTQSLHTNSMDETLALPSDKAAKLALRTQQVIAEESGVTNTIDPLAGSYFVEQLTNSMEEEAERYFVKIDDLGGVVPAIEKGFFQQEIANSAYVYQNEIESDERVIVGVNEFVEEERVDIPLLVMDQEGQNPIDSADAQLTVYNQIAGCTNSEPPLADFSQSTSEWKWAPDPNSLQYWYNDVRHPIPLWRLGPHPHRQPCARARRLRHRRHRVFRNLQHVGHSDQVQLGGRLGGFRRRHGH